MHTRAAEGVLVILALHHASTLTLRRGKNVFTES